jgi:hypothetical protein
MWISWAGWPQELVSPTYPALSIDVVLVHDLTSVWDLTAAVKLQQPLVLEMV